MDFLYHRVPKNMSGTVLYPLNVLKETHPEIYAEHVKKYENREKLLRVEIPPLKCLWNDVLHFTAVSPQELKEYLAKADISYDPMAWFKVPVTMIDKEKSVVFFYRKGTQVIMSIKNLEEYEPFDPKRMEIYKRVPEETIEYYKEKKAQGLHPLLFHLIPHILYRGSIETKDLEIVTL